ncbi:uncharacterized protein BP5553_09686 [Venustampulla echinocandica]|uniref:FAD dependent oxidoreductase domain-containing protein n=1 Tax=Venustampulla echinocandica TaxID=2656787 RepID=A0A370TBR4_9HELO|nr:uncharacterized protein BP5553_09686 [Venustampulla echinocandica]RDL31477.1 hypothetical protein BP5553_09686 [Venustampulla echinocandica]
MTSAQRPSYIIVGAGVFGASTAYHLSKSHPEVSVILIDRSSSFPCSLGASHDYNKIVRADYENLFYCGLALEAREAWKSDPLYTPFYHQSGLVNLDNTGLGRKIVRNYEDLKVYSEAAIISPEEMKGRYNGLFADTDYQDVEEIFINPLSGWAEATPAVGAVIEASVANGVKFVEGDVKNIICNENGDCTGVETEDGRALFADKIILSTGAGTAKLLAKSYPRCQNFQARDRITAAAVVTGVVRLNEKQLDRFRESPVFIHNIDNVLGEVLPPTSDGLLKFCVDVSFMNTSLDLDSGQLLSAPPNFPDQAQYEVPANLKDECCRVVRGIYGKQLAGFSFESFRICWDGITPSQDFIISEHPTSNLYIATGGSFHGWKFLPTIGKYVTQLLDGRLPEDLN